MTMLFTIEPTTNGTTLTQFSDYELPYSLFGKVVDKLRFSKVVDKEVTLALENTKKALEARVVLSL